MPGGLVHKNKLFIAIQSQLKYFEPYYFHGYVYKIV